ncbi:CusA/CzcA family heavy metal efflux RND transporter [bacterium]|nr:CusA/CzcA family heavy metal efflux RND transporter [bacterium]
MLERLVKFSLSNRWVVLGTFAFLAVLGAWSVQKLPIDAVPDITNVQVVVNSKTGALDPEKIELLVTRPIEVELTGLVGLDEIRSISRYGLSQVTLVFVDGTDIYWARQQVSERLQNVRGQLPPAVTTELAPVTTGLGEVVMYSVEAEPGSELSKMSETERLTELRTAQDFIIAPQLKRVAGIAEVDSNGGYEKQIHVNFFPDRLERFGLTADVLVARLETLGENFGGGYIQREGRQIIVRSVPGIPNLEALRNYPLGLNVRGRPIRVSDVAEVQIDHPLRLGAATRNGEETVLGTLLMRVGANSREVAIQAQKTIAKLELPKGVQVVPLYSRSFLVDATIHTVIKSLTEGAVLVIAVLLLLLGNWRASLIVASAIPLSMLLAARGMSLFGVSANLMSLGAIDFGLLVDGSVVLVENILSRLSTSLASSREQKREIIEHACVEVLNPIVFGLSLIMVVYVPILTLESIEGKMFRPMAITVLLALAASLFIAVFLMPVLADMFLSIPKGQPGQEHPVEHETFFFRWAKKAYLPVLDASFAHRAWLVGLAGILIVMAGFVLSRMGSNFIPNLDEGDLVITLARDTRQGIDSSVEVQKKVEALLATYPEVERVFSRIGTAESATDPMGANLADTFLMLKKDRNQWTHPDKEALFKDMEARIKTLNVVQEASQTQPIEMRFNEMLEGSRADITLRVLGPDLENLYEAIEASEKVLKTIPGIESVESDPLTALKKSEMLDVSPDYAKLARLGINVSEVNRFLELSMGGKEVGSFIENSLRFPIVVHLDENLREQQSVIESLPLPLPAGGTVKLSEVANFSIQNKVTTIARSWGERYAAISINLEGRDVSSFVEEAKSKVESSIKLPEGYRFFWGGQFKNLTRAKVRLWIVVPSTLVAVFIVLLWSLGSFPQTVLVFSTIPFAAVGGVLLLFVRGIPLSVSAMIGFIALIGIALLNTIVLINVFQQRIRTGTSPLHTSIREGAISRLRPVLMTALVASLGFVPMALNTGIGAEVQRPLATVIIGGLITSTILTLVLLPGLYEWTIGKKPAALKTSA